MSPVCEMPPRSHFTIHTYLQKVIIRNPCCWFLAKIGLDEGTVRLTFVPIWTLESSLWVLAHICRSETVERVKIWKLHASAPPLLLSACNDDTCLSRPQSWNTLNVISHQRMIHDSNDLPENQREPNLLTKFCSHQLWGTCFKAGQDQKIKISSA